MTPAAVVTTEPPKSATDAAAAAKLGPLGKSLLQQAEVHSGVFVPLACTWQQNPVSTWVNALAMRMHLSAPMLRLGPDARP